MKRINVIVMLVLLIISVFLSGCNQSDVSKQESQSLQDTKDFVTPDYKKIKTSKTNKFNFILAFGIYGRNILNTFDEKFTKDLVQGSSTINFKLSEAEMNLIKEKMKKIDISSYPEKFKPQENGHLITPYSTYYLRVELNGKINEIYWEDQNESLEKNAKELRDLIKEISEIVYKREEYKKMPQPLSGYD